MLHLLIIALFIVIALRDSVAQESGGARAGGDVAAAPGWVWLATLGPMLALAGAAVLVIGALARRVERKGSWRAAMLADRALDVTRISALLIHACNVLVLGWLGAVRGVTGDLIAVDELLAIGPALLVIVAGWWAYYPIDERLRASTTFRLLETGQPQYPPLSRGKYVTLNIRHQVLLTLVPISMIAAWSECVECGLAWLAKRGAPSGWIGPVGPWLRDESNLAAATVVLQLLGVAVVFIISPLVLRRVWDTVRLESGPMHDRLMALCKSSNVNIRDLLVWRTHGTMLNGAVIGLIGPLRYILLTDALLDQLPQRQVEAVMAHEVGHARHAHMPWLAASMLAGFTAALVIVSVFAWGAVNLINVAGHAQLAKAMHASNTLAGFMAMLSFAGGIVWFGFVSRRFEWQADAFAVQQLSRTIEAETLPSPPTSPPANATGHVSAASTPYPFSTIVSTLDLGAFTQVSTMPGAPLPPSQPRAFAPNTVRPDAVAAMTGALDSVAELNHISTTRFTWRHGSIAHRQRRLRAMSGQPLGAQRIDGTVRWVKRGVVVGMLLLVGMLVLERALMGEPPEPPATKLDGRGRR